MVSDYGSHVIIEPFDYARDGLADALRAVGISAGATVFVHSNVGFFGRPAGGLSPANVFATIFGAFQDVLTESGTLVVPAFTYSFPRKELFDPALTPSTCGLFAETVRTLPGALRSHDPIFSVAAWGALALDLTRDAPEDSFGEGSFFARFAQADGIICNLNFDAGSTFIHYVEKQLAVPYRYDKSFEGTLRLKEVSQPRRQVIFVHDLNRPELVAEFTGFDRLARERGRVRSVTVGRGSVVAINAADTASLIRETLGRRPWFLTRAEKMGVDPDLAPRTGPNGYPVPVICPGSDAPSLVAALQQALAPLPRFAAGAGSDAALAILRQVRSLTVRHYATGSRIEGHIVPERQEADGSRHFSALAMAETEVGRTGGRTYAVPCDLDEESGLAPALAIVLFKLLALRPLRSRWRLIVSPQPFSATYFVNDGEKLVHLGALSARRERRARREPDIARTLADLIGEITCIDSDRGHAQYG